MRRATILTALAALPLAACGTNPAADLDLDAVADAGTMTDTAIGGDTDLVDDTTIVTDESPLVTCDATPLWRSEEAGFWFDRAAFGFTPNEGLLVLSHHDGMSGGVWRTTDGERVGSTGSRIYDAIDARWHRSVATRHSSTFAVETVVTGDVLFEIQSTPEQPMNWLGSTISADGQTAAALHCADDPNGARVTLTVVDVDRRAATDHTIPVGGEMYCWSYGDRPQLAFDPDATALVFTLPGTATLYRLDVDSGDVQSVVAHPDIIDGGAWSPGPDLLDLALSPDGATVATSGADGRVRLWAIADLAPIGDGFDAGWQILNEMTYAAPHAASPLAWTPQGDLLAHIDPDGNVAVRAVADGRLLHVFEMPTGPGEDFGISPGVGALSFTPDGAALAAADMHGASMWGCHTPSPTPSHDLSVLLEVPESAPINEPVTFVATHLGSDHFHTHRFLVDDTIVHYGGPDREMTWYPTETGTYLVTVIVDDGASQVSASRPITIR